MNPDELCADLDDAGYIMCHMHSAAPKLLEALKDLLEAAEACMDAGQQSAWCMERDAARAAIAKAEGKT